MWGLRSCHQRLDRNHLPGDPSPTGGVAPDLLRHRPGNPDGPRWPASWGATASTCWSCGTGSQATPRRSWPATRWATPWSRRMRRTSPRGKKASRTPIRPTRPSLIAAGENTPSPGPSYQNLDGFEQALRGMRCVSSNHPSTFSPTGFFLNRTRGDRIRAGSHTCPCDFWRAVTLARIGPETPTDFRGYNPPRLDRPSCCRIKFTSERWSPSAHDRAPRQPERDQDTGAFSANRASFS
jgi:hypothetical protein